jgi:tRNA nucleotidyltransferase (CCA-adding enzyme)
MTELKILFENHVDVTVKQQTLYIIQRYLDAGYECWVVGGPVRDLLLGLSPKDIDFATNCPLEVTKTLFGSVIPTGEDHGTLTIHLDGENYEVTRYRKDVDTDGRRATIEYAETIQEDVLRRDLTVNAIAFNPVTGEVVDSVGGLEDFETRTLRFVGNTKDRVLEDHLRALRYVRFVSRLEPFGFKPSDNIMEEIYEVFDADVLSVERIYQEIRTMFNTFQRNGGKGVDFVEAQTKLLNVFERFSINKEQHDKMVERIFETMDFFPLAYEYYMSSIEKEKTIMQNLRLPKDYAKWVVWFEEFRTADFSNTVVVKDLLERMQGDYELADKFFTWYEVYGVENNHEDGKETLRNLKEKAENGQEEPFMITSLAINGKDLINKGLKGEQIGLKQRELIQAVKANPNLNNRDVLFSMI